MAIPSWKPKVVFQVTATRSPFASRYFDDDGGYYCGRLRLRRARTFGHDEVPYFFEHFFHLTPLQEISRADSLDKIEHFAVFAHHLAEADAENEKPHQLQKRSQQYCG
jgi:hypothetical protein